METVPVDSPAIAADYRERDVVGSWPRLNGAAGSISRYVQVCCWMRRCVIECVVEYVVECFIECVECVVGCVG